MGWNGGVSLAVWMGGVAVELDCARRSHLAEEESPIPRRVYHALCQAFDRELVLDIFAGASAGGVNSALLGAAIFKGRRLHPDFLRDKWLSIGDFSGLLQPTNIRQPKSVMQGEKFKLELDRAFRELMDGPSEGTTDLCALPPGQEALQSFCPPLDIQATNVLGQQHSFGDAWGHELVAREYRSPFRFREPANFDPGLLATAARASASFPAAFEPLQVDGDALKLAGLAGGVDAANYRFAIDGGLLENAPIRQAIDLIPRRSASGPVKRFVCYVNANPSSWTADKVEPDPPSLRDVIGYVVNLPRVGRDADQWTAITDAARRGRDNEKTIGSLVELPQTTLVEIAAALFASYRRRRVQTAIDELMEPVGPRLKSDVVNAIVTATGDLLPFEPSAFTIPPAPQWDWGFRAAQRVCYLELDLLAGALRATREGEAPAVTQAQVASIVYTARPQIDAAITQIENAHAEFVAFPGLRDQLAALASPLLDDEQRDQLLATIDAAYASFEEPGIRAPIEAAAESFYEAATRLAWLAALPYPYESLFGAAPPPASGTVPPIGSPGLQAWLERALAIEVVRRAFVDDRVVDAANSFSFTQLAPNATIAIFTKKPFSTKGPSNPEDKLTGIRLGHFAGFYRSSWRANDFMWGRLDAATRIIDFLVDPSWKERLGAAQPWTALAESLVRDDASDAATGDERELVREALEDVRESAEKLAALGELDAGVCQALQGPPIPSSSDSTALRARVEDALQVDLSSTDEKLRGRLTRTLLARAAQLEILRQELPVLVEESRRDQTLGDATPPLKLQTTGSLLPAIDELRDFAGKKSLPMRLGRESGDESASTLALRPVSQTALVALAALPGIAMPLSRITVPMRLPFLSVAGVTARHIVSNVAALVAFGAASFYLTARIITSDNNEQREAATKGSHQVLAGELVSPPVLAMGLALLVVLGIVAVPVWRAARSDRNMTKAMSALWALLLALSGGAVAIAAGIVEIGTAQTLTGSGGFNPGKWVIGPVFVGAGVGIAGVRQLALLRKATEALRERRPWATSVLSIGAAGLLLIWSAPHIIHALNDGSSWHAWHRVAAVAALASMPILFACAFLRSWIRRLVR
jgi:patatin-related protein